MTNFGGPSRFRYEIRLGALNLHHEAGGLPEQRHVNANLLHLMDVFFRTTVAVF